MNNVRLLRMLIMPIYVNTRVEYKYKIVIKSLNVNNNNSYLVQYLNTIREMYKNRCTHLELYNSGHFMRHVLDYIHKFIVST